MFIVFEINNECIYVPTYITLLGFITYIYK